jgi:hypothetical protein
VKAAPVVGFDPGLLLLFLQAANATITHATQTMFFTGQCFTKNVPGIHFARN